MGNSQFDGVWNLVVSLQGEQFETKTGKPFTYEVRGNIVNPSRTQYNIARSDFERVIEVGCLMAQVQSATSCAARPTSGPFFTTPA